MGGAIGDAAAQQALPAAHGLRAPYGTRGDDHRTGALDPAAYEGVVDWRRKKG